MVPTFNSSGDVLLVAKNNLVAQIVDFICSSAGDEEEENTEANSKSANSPAVSPSLASRIADLFFLLAYGTTLVMCLFAFLRRSRSNKFASA
jgi:hypothetical protein